MIGRGLSELALLDSGSFREWFHGVYYALIIGKLEACQNALRAVGEEAPLWRQDVLFYQEELSEALCKYRFPAVADLPHASSALEHDALLQSLLERCGQMLRCWPDLMAACSKLKQSGRDMSVFD